MYKPPSTIPTEAAQRAALIAERERVRAWAGEVAQTKNMHLDNLSNYTHRLRTTYASIFQEYDYEHDANIQYYQKAIGLCDERLDFLRLKYKNLSELIGK